MKRWQDRLKKINKIVHILTMIYVNTLIWLIVLIKLFLLQFFFLELNPATLIHDVKNPFGRIKFFQFLHYLMELSWQVYGKNGVGIEGVPGILGSALEKLIRDDIIPNARNHNGKLNLMDF